MIVELSSAERRALRAAAHSLQPVVSVAQQGLSPSVLAEIERSLEAHGLIKIRVFGEDRAQREALFTQICEAASAAPVQHIGNILVIWRQKPESAPKVTARPKAAPRNTRLRKAERVESKARGKR
jgi:putative YhbY family RNA-binding protein